VFGGRGGVTGERSRIETVSGGGEWGGAVDGEGSRGERRDGGGRGGRSEELAPGTRGMSGFVRGGVWANSEVTVQELMNWEPLPKREMLVEGDRESTLFSITGLKNGLGVAMGPAIQRTREPKSLWKQ